MSRRAFRQRLTAWIATFAVLLGALAPAVSQAMVAYGDGDVRWLEVCTTGGMLWVAVDAAGGDQSPDDGSGLMAAHCPFCCTHAGTFALPPAAAPVFAVAGPHALQPALYYVAPHPLFVWASAHPRAPPRAS